ncbi:nitroreductase family protein [Micromonospora sp. BRA006-A]|nr:nitroreductase family protein [Micromonospora sp. BRA006-A]
MTTAADELIALDRAAQDLLFRAARTANAFTDEPVTDEHVRAVHDLVRYGPTAMNAQPLRVLLLRSAAARARLLPYVSAGNRDKTASAPLTAVLAADVDWHDRLPELFRTAPARGTGSPATRPAGRRRPGSTPRSRSATCCSAYAPPGWPPDRWPGSTRQAWNASSSRRAAPVLLLMNIGRPAPDAWRERLPRLPYEEVVDTL